MECPHLDKFSNNCTNPKGYSKPDSYTLGALCCGNPHNCPKNGGGGSAMDNLVDSMFKKY